jgi:carbonic anhydrase
MEKLVEGFRRFRKEAFPVYEAHAQSPQTLFTYCSDSRVMRILTQWQPRALAGRIGC